MFEIYETDKAGKAAFHPTVTPLLATLNEAIASFAHAQCIDNPEKLFSSLSALDSLKTHPAHQRFMQAYRALLGLEASADCYRALIDAKQEAKSRLSEMGNQKERLLADIESMQTMIQADQQAYTLAIASNNVDRIAELETRHKSLKESIAAMQDKVSLLDGKAKLIPQSLLVILAQAESKQIEAYKEKRVAELMPDFEKAKQDFIQACQKIAGYKPGLFYERTNAFGDLWRGKEAHSIEQFIKQLPALSSAEIADELSRAA